MNKLVYLLIVVVSFTPLLAAHASRIFGLLPEVLSAFILCIVLLYAAAHRQLFLSNKYVILGIIVTIHITLGTVVNNVDPGTIATGMRPYVKWIPVFLLPTIYHFSNTHLNKQIKLVLALSILQCPITLYQRFIQYRSYDSGDVITGTFGGSASGALSIFLVSIFAILTAYYVRDRIAFKSYIVLTLLVLIPTTINETKVTMFLLPIAVVVPYLFAAKRLTIPRLFSVSSLGVVVLVAFIVGYDYVETSMGSPSILEFYESGQADRYMYNENTFKLKDIWSNNKIGQNFSLERNNNVSAGGRLDDTLLPIKTLSKKPVQFWFGLGVGNVSNSIISQFTGKYADKLGLSGVGLLFSMIFWEIGCGGIIFLSIFLFYIFSDTYKLRSDEGGPGAFAAGWLGVLAIIIITLPYANILYFSPIIFLFSYFSGYIVSERNRMRNRDTSLVA